MVVGSDDEFGVADGPADGEQAPSNWATDTDLNGGQAAGGMASDKFDDWLDAVGIEKGDTGQVDADGCGGDAQWLEVAAELVRGCGIDLAVKAHIDATIPHRNLDAIRSSAPL